ncbi:MAG: DNA-binding response regulator [Bacteroidetes bacterium]|nr:MAG: DNA-binding response regulator [Bacteroidota bacterium]RLD85516.1 MAG: DNA-binding response regulator [Bacteroidota bacterium]
MNVLIIEDEPFAQNELKRLLAIAIPEVVILDCIDSVEDSVLWFTRNRHPDLVFMDIQLADGLSFDIFNKVKITSPVIFTTAFDEYAIQAFKVNSIDYLLKPVELSALKKALEKLEELKKQYRGDSSFINQNQLEKLLELSKPGREYKSRFITKIGDQIKSIKVQDVAYFYAEDNEVFISSLNNRPFIIDYALNQLSGMLDPKYFFRINRAYIVNINAIHKIHKFFNSRLKIDLEPARNDTILISRVKVPEFLEWMEK